METKIRLFEIAISLVILAVFSIIDFQTKRVPNIIIFPVMGMTAIFLIFREVLSFQPFSLVMRLVLLGLLFIFGMTGIIGIGDIKLLMTLALLNDPLYILFTTFLACVGVLLTTILKAPKQTMKNLRSFVQMICITRSADASVTNKIEIPFVPYIMAGYLIVVIVALFI